MKVVCAENLGYFYQLVDVVSPKENVVFSEQLISCQKMGSNNFGLTMEPKTHPVDHKSKE